jgi:hypothetical protein
MEWVVNATPQSLYPRERSRTHCLRDWVGLRAGLDGCGKSRHHRDSIPGPSSSKPTFVKCSVCYRIHYQPHTGCDSFSKLADGALREIRRRFYQSVLYIHNAPSLNVVPCMSIRKARPFPKQIFTKLKKNPHSRSLKISTRPANKDTVTLSMR